MMNTTKSKSWPPKHDIIDEWFKQKAPDIVLQVNEFDIACHKEVLSGQSHYFKVRY